MEADFDDDDNYDGNPTRELHCASPIGDRLIRHLHLKSVSRSAAVSPKRFGKHVRRQALDMRHSLYLVVERAPELCNTMLARFVSKVLLSAACFKLSKDAEGGIRRRRSTLVRYHVSKWVKMHAKA